MRPVGGAGAMPREYTGGMRRLHSLLLHALLSLALVANGIGAAMASAQAGCVHSATAVALSIDESSVEAPPVAEPPCHGGMAQEAASPTHDGAHASLPGDASSTDGHGDDGNCGNACDCACKAHSQAALMPPTLLLHASARIAHADTPVYDHAAPALPHPVRPPIG